uniref:Uncharacterized protein n=1 Tax=Castor canadensis TaxID=51338 RepID=A0A8C0WPD0_CASCN
MVDMAVGKDKCREQGLVSLPMSCIRVFMKSSPEVSSINEEHWCSWPGPPSSLFSVQHPFLQTGGRKEERALIYCALANTAEESEPFQFLSAQCSLQQHIY